MKRIIIGAALSCIFIMVGCTKDPRKIQITEKNRHTFMQDIRDVKGYDSSLQIKSRNIWRGSIKYNQFIDSQKALRMNSTCRYEDRLETFQRPICRREPNGRVAAIVCIIFTVYPDGDGKPKYSFAG